MRPSHLPLRLTTGAFILNSGLTKRKMPAEAAAGLHGFASGALPPVQRFQPQQFTSMLSKTEIALGAALLAPFVSPVVAGAALTAFGAGLVQLYLRTPGFREAGSLAPTEAGLAVAKDVWLVGVGAALLIDGLIDGTKKTARTAVSAVTPGH